MTSKTMDWRPGPTVCRCCLSEGCYKDISTEYFWMGKREVYAEMLSETFSLSIAYSQSGGPNSNSRLICEPCISRLRDASDFRRQVQECEKTFMQYLDPGTSIADLDAAPMDALDTQVKVERVKLEKDESDEEFDDRADFRDDDDDDDDLDDQPLTKLASKVPKKESVDLLDLLDNAKAGEKRKSTSKAKAPAAKKSKAKKEAKATSSKAPKPEKKKKGSAIADKDATVSVVKSRRNLKENVSERQMRRRRRANNEFPEESEKRLAKTMMRRNAMILLECSTAWPFRWFHGVFYCSYCEAKFVDIDPLREHVMMYHSHEPPTKKIFAKITENNMLKIDIGCLSCRLCKGNMVSIDALKDHLQTFHGRSLNVGYSDGVLPFKLGNDGFHCQKCFVQFDSFPKVDQHMNTHYQNYVCDECGKPFVSKSRFRKHVQSHETGRFPCGECEEVLHTRVERMCHKLKIHKKGYRYCCPRCSQAFTSYYTRAKHLVDQHGQQKIDYECPACGKIFENGSKRAAHFRLTHANIDKKYECSECLTKFITKSKLQRHLLTHLKKESL